MASAVGIEPTQSVLETVSPNPWNMGGYTKKLFDDQDLNASLFQIMLGREILLTTIPIVSSNKNGSLVGT